LALQIKTIAASNNSHFVVHQQSLSGFGK